jgi:glycosyltransferase involved in cell wall biosynthesis
VIAGDGPDLEKLNLLIDELKIRDSVSMLGRRDDMPSVYASLDILVSSSRLEGLPMTILEGMASRLPLIATPVGDVPTVVLDGRTGILVPSENAEALSARIVDLLRHPEERERLGAAARKLIEDEFSATRMTTDYLFVYENATAVAREKTPL